MLETASLRVYVRESGNGRPLLFLHGYPFTGHFWRHQLAGLAGDFRCLAVDLRGFGETDKPGVRITRDLLIRDVVEVLDALGISRAGLVGHDFGSIIASAVALRRPDRISAVALLDAPVSVWFPRGGHGWWFKDPGRAEQFFQQYGTEYIRSRFTGSPVTYTSRPVSPWPSYQALPFLDAQDIDHYVRSFDRADVWEHAISYYRNALPFHDLVLNDNAIHNPDVTYARRHFRFRSEQEVGDEWNSGEPLELLDSAWPIIAPEDEHLASPLPALFVFTSSLVPEAFPLDGGSVHIMDHPVPTNPMTAAITRNFPRLRTSAIDLNHAFPEQAPALTNKMLAEFFISTAMADHPAASLGQDKARCD
jgi:pimeloyl-ACP methyl ester carboxylesterase